MFEKIANGVTRHYKKIIVIWIVALLLAVPAILQVNSVMDYQYDLGSGDDYESIRAQNFIQGNFDQSVANGTIMILLQAEDVTDPAVRDYVLALQQWALDNEELQHLEDVTSVYTYSEAILSQIIISIYEAEEQVNMAASMLWGIPAMHAQAWEESVNSGPPDVADERAYASVSDQLKESPEDPNAMLAIGYYNAFASAWNATSEVPGMVADPVTRANGAVINAAPPFIGGLPLLDEEKQVMLAVLNGFNVTTFNDATLVHGFTLGMVGNAAQITNTTFLQGVYDLGPVYDEAKVAAYAHTVVAESTLDELLGAMPADLQDNFETLLNN
ncbi:MAG: hypothetical protein GX307_05935, partial [Euryarchaeota archaeon]|nr:hypothetical protein [Euryarchaeota archaeon]